MSFAIDGRGKVTGFLLPAAALSSKDGWKTLQKNVLLMMMLEEPYYVVDVQDTTVMMMMMLLLLMMMMKL